MTWVSRDVAFDLERWLEVAEAVATSRGWPRSEVGGTRASVVCLHSSLRSELGRWTVVAADPVAVVEGDCGEVRLRARDASGGFVEVGRFADPFDAVAAMLAPWSEPDGGEDDGFRGGAIGVFGYGCRRALERLPAEGAAVSSGEPDVWFGLYSTFLCRDARSQTSQLVSRGLHTWGEAPSQAVAEACVAAWAEALDGADGLAPELPPAWPTLSPAVTPEAYQVAFERVMAAIAEGVIYQGCLTFPLVGPRGEQTAASLFRRLLREHPAPFASLLVPDAPIAMAGGSPERFLSIHRGRARVRPMKGTRPRHADAAEDLRLRDALASSPKDRAENVMIVDLMRNDLGRVCRLGTVSTPTLFEVESYASVHQMTSTVEGVLMDPADPVSAIRACFPPGSMTGAPKVSAMDLLGHLEVHRRGWYAGVHGWIDLGARVELSVVIRSALVGPEVVRWHVGGGIVADSTGAGEWQEALDKCPLRR